MANAGGVDDIGWNSFDVDGLGDFIARGASDRCDDGDIIAGESIEQR